LFNHLKQVLSNNRITPDALVPLFIALHQLAPDQD
jgi:hypothetical protein